MERILVLATAGVIAFFASSALASAEDTSTYKSHHRITLSGTVEKIKNNQEFTLRDNSGSFDVTIPDNTVTVLNEGDSVIVIGSRGSNAADIEADSVQVHRRADL